MAKIVPNTPPETFASLLLEKGVVGAIMGLRRLNGKAFMCLITSKDDLEGFAPLFPIMPSNGAKAVSQLTLNEPVSKPVAVFLRPCEIRALIELTKLNQAHLDNLLIVGIECNGVVPNKEFFIQQRGDELYDSYLEACKAGRPFEEAREVCKGCEYPYPHKADIVVSCIGRDSTLVALSEKGEDVIKSLGLSQDEGPQQTENSLTIQREREDYSQSLRDKMKEEVKGIEGMLKLFGRCISCHNCSHVCPICYCKDCFFESATFDYEAESYENRLLKKESFRMPLDTMLFHLGRMTHMVTSCVACGMCEDVCPMDIPVARIFKAVGRDVQDLFDYVPGRDTEEELPLTTFRYDELHEVEDR